MTGHKSIQKVSINVRTSFSIFKGTLEYNQTDCKFSTPSEDRLNYGSTLKVQKKGIVDNKFLYF